MLDRIELAEEVIKLMRENAQNSMMVDCLTAENEALINVLMKARMALCATRVDVMKKEADRLVIEAIAEIDKVMGWNEE